MQSVIFLSFILYQYLRQLCRIELRLGRMDPAQLRDLLEQLRH